MVRRIGLASFAVIACLAATLSAWGAETKDEVLSRSYGFGVDIAGCPEASRDIRGVYIDDLIIGALDEGAPPATEGRLYGPGACHWGQARFTSACTLGGSKELQQWWQEAAKGKNIRKNITVTLYKSDKSPGRSYALLDCSPLSWSVSIDPVRHEPVETVDVSIGQIVFVPGGSSTSPPKSSATVRSSTSDKFAQVRGFQVEITGATGKEVDTAWESISGGTLNLDVSYSSATGSDKFSTTSPGHKSVSDITLRGAMTDRRSALCTWINETVQGKSWKRTLTVTELLMADGSVRDGKSYSYVDCFPVRYVFPKLSASSREGNVSEEVVCRVVRETPIPTDTTVQLEIQECPLASRSGHRLLLDDRALDTSLIESKGDARNPSARLELPLGTGGELLDWFKGTADGTAAPKLISIQLPVSPSGSGQVSINLFECWPVSFEATGSSSLKGTPKSSGGGGGSGGTPSEALTVKIGRIEFKV